MTLESFFRQYPKVAVAFSGGVDSAYLLWAAKQSGADVRPYYVKTAFQPQFEYADAQTHCQQLGLPLTTLCLDILAEEAVASNPANRCYHCKTRIFTAICQAARQDGYSVILDGTNASDNAADRPGMQALTQLQVLSPLRLCGLTKGEIRRLSKEAGLFTHDKPAYACLATRIPTGKAITPALLAKTERSEAFLQSLGFRDFRIRLEGEAAKLQLTQGQLPLLLDCRQKILEVLKQDYTAVLLDLEVRDGE